MSNIKKILFVFGFCLLLFSGFVSAGLFSNSWEKIKGTITGYSATGCMDSDGGIEPYVSGYTYGSSAGGMMDSCLNSHFLKEAFCTSTGGISAKIIECEYGCNAGKCNTREECESPEGCKLNQNYCLDEDFGNYFEKGDLYMVNVGWYDNGSDLFSYQGTDSCRDSNWLEEYICQPTGRHARKFVVCPDGCLDGACIKGEKYLEAQRANCIDSFEGPSGGYRLFEKGQVSYDGKIYEDFCASKEILTEYMCDAFGLLKKANTGCFHGCEDGVCLKFPKTEVSNETDNLTSRTEIPTEDPKKEELSCQDEGKCTFLGQRYCEGNISFVCGYFDMDSCLDVKWSVCPGACENGICVMGNDSKITEPKTVDSSLSLEEINLIAKGFKVVSRDNEKIILLDFDEKGLIEGQEYFVSFSHSLDRGATFEGESLIPRDLLELEGFGIYPNSNYFEEGKVTIITIKADMNPHSLERLYGGRLEESSFEDNCVQQSFRISDSFIYSEEKDVVPIRDFKGCDGEIFSSTNLGEDFFNETECAGCLLNGDCYLPGEVFEGKYCSPLNKNFVRQFEIRGYCQEDYQCISGICEEGRCSRVKSLFGSDCFSGCPLGNSCYSVGFRKDNLFCSDEGFFVPIKGEESLCDFDYECFSDFCNRGICVNPNFVQRVLREIGVYPKI